MTSTTRPRSLADDFRRRGRAQIAVLLESRPDLLDPIPESLSQLAMRASNGPSVRMALHHVDARTLAVAQAVAQEPVTTDPEQLAVRVDSDDAAAVVEHGLAGLHRIGLLWHDGARYHPVRELVTVVRTVAPGTPAQVSGSGVDPAIGREYEQAQIDRSAGLHGLLAVDEMRTALDALQVTPVGLTRDGKVVQRDLLALAEHLQWTAAHTAMWLELGWLCELLGPTADATAVRPTERASQWATQPLARSWVQLLTTWWNVDRDWSAFVDPDPVDRPVVFGDGHVLSNLVRLRALWAEILLRAPVGASVTNVGEIIRFDQPLAWPNERRLQHLLLWNQRQADLFGVTSHGALSTLGRLIAAGEVDAVELESAASAALPEVRDRIIVQADLTIIAPTPLPHELAKELRGFASVESTGGATVYRLSPDSLVAGLSAGMTADSMLDLLRSHSDVPLPQPVEFLVRDTAASHGRVRVGKAASFLTAQDAHSMTAVLAALGALSAGVQRISDTVAVTDLEPEHLLRAARAAGFPATGDESTTAAVVLAPPPRIPAPVQGTPQRRVQAVLDALYTEDVGAATTAMHSIPDVERMHSAQVQHVLSQASDQGRPVWLRYADNAGASSVRMISALSLVSGAVEAFDVERGAVRRFAVSRIVGAQIAEGQEN